MSRLVAGRCIDALLLTAAAFCFAMAASCSSSFDPKTLFATPCPFTAPDDAGAAP